MRSIEKNIEEILFDYVEGNLSSTEKNKVDAFLKEHPKYKEDLEAWTVAYVEPEPIKFMGKEELMDVNRGGKFWSKGFFLSEVIIALFTSYVALSSVASYSETTVKEENIPAKQSEYKSRMKKEELLVPEVKAHQIFLESTWDSLSSHIKSSAPNVNVSMPVKKYKKPVLESDTMEIQQLFKKSIKKVVPEKEIEDDYKNEAIEELREENNDPEEPEQMDGNGNEEEDSKKKRNKKRRKKKNIDIIPLGNNGF